MTQHVIAYSGSFLNIYTTQPTVTYTADKLDRNAPIVTHHPRYTNHITIPSTNHNTDKSITPFVWVSNRHLTLQMTSTQDSETSLTTNSPSQDSFHPDDQIPLRLLKYYKNMKQQQQQTNKQKILSKINNYSSGYIMKAFFLLSLISFLP